MDCRLLSLGNFCPTHEEEQPLDCSHVVRVQAGRAGMSPSAPRDPHLPHVLRRIRLGWFMAAAAAAFPTTGICPCHLLLFTLE